MNIPDPRLEEEIRHHVEEHADRLMDRGLEPDEARRRAEAAFGDAEAIRREVARIHEPRRSLPGRAWDRIAADLAFALRQSGRSPGFAAVAILTLGLGIGASASIFSLVKAVVLDPLPYAAADRIVLFQEVSPDGGAFTVSDLNFRDYRERVDRLELMTAVSRADYALDVEGRALQVVAGMVTGDFFPLFEATPVLGRTFTEDESGSTPQTVTVLAHDFWLERYGGDSTVVGSTLALDGVSHEVIGVMPRGWEPGEDVDVWTPLPLSYAERGDHDYTVMARLAGGASLEDAAEEVVAVARELGREHPASNEGWGARVTPLKQALIGPERIQAGRVLLGAVAMLLLMSCASVSNLLLARASGRGREMALRATLGAGRGRLVQQLLTESLLLSVAGAALGLALSHAFLPVLQGLSPPGTPRLEGAIVSGAVVLFAAALAVTTAILFGLAPVLHVLRDALSAKHGSRVAGSGGDRLRSGLVVAQIALSLALLVGAGALGRSFLALQQVDPGLPLEHAVVVPLMMSGDRYSAQERQVAREEIITRLSGIPGVAAVGSTNVLPFSGMSTVIDVNVEGRPTEADQAPFVRWRAVSEGFFEAAGLRPLAGRLLSRPDYDESAEAAVVLTETMAGMLFGDPREAVGQRVGMGWDGRNYREVVGVVADVEDLELGTVAPPVFFFPDPGMLPWVNLLVRFRADGVAPSPQLIREAVWSVDPGLPVPTVEPLGARFEGSVAGYGFNLLVVGSFASVALLLALLGIYGLVLFTVERRTREIGVRIALGARPEGIAKLVLGQGLRLAAIGIVLGTLLSFGMTRFVQALLYGVDAAHPAHFIVPVVLLAGAALLATWIPAAKAMRVDPGEALTAE